MASFETFEKTAKGDTPHRLLDNHPDGNYLVLQGGRGPESAVWEKKTGRIVWAPDNAIALAWLNQGTQIAVLSEPPHHYEFALFSWPETHLLQRCPVASPDGWGWMLDLAISPKGDLALCHWVDQTEAGFEFINITAQGVSQDSQAGYFFEGTNDVTRPVFSPDGQLWAFGYKMYEIWWAPDPEDIDTFDQPARGGKYPLGALQIFRGKQPLSRTIPLIATLPAGWLPIDPDAEEVLCLGDPVFLDAHHVQIRLPSGETQIHQVSVD